MVIHKVMRVCLLVTVCSHSTCYGGNNCIAMMI